MLDLLRTGKTSSFSIPSFSEGLYCLLSMDFFRPRPEDVDALELDLCRIAVPSAACSLRNARNSAGAISGWT